MDKGFIVKYLLTINEIIMKENLNNFNDNIYVGIDISKDKFDVFIYPLNRHFVVGNTNKEITVFVKELNKEFNKKQLLIGMEATGIYHKELFKQLSLAGVNVAVLNPKKIYNFAKSLGDGAKTDKKDARTIALFLSKFPDIKPSVYSASSSKLQALTTNRDQTVRLIAIRKNQLQSYSKDNKEIIASVKQDIAYLKKKKEKMESLILEIIGANEELKHKKELLETAPGIGKVISLILISYLPELGTLSGKQIASLTGIAPKNKDSGKMQKERTIVGGRAIVRNALFLSSLSTCRSKKSSLSIFYKKLTVEKNKNKKLALIAMTRKLIVILNSMIKNNTEWREIPVSNTNNENLNIIKLKDHKAKEQRATNGENIVSKSIINKKNKKMLVA